MLSSHFKDQLDKEMRKSDLVSLALDDSIVISVELTNTYFY